MSKETIAIIPVEDKDIILETDDEYDLVMKIDSGEYRCEFVYMRKQEVFELIMALSLWLIKQ